MKINLTQLEQVKLHLKRKKSLTSWDAITLYRITRLSAHIYELREQGINIKSERIQKKDVWYVKYKLIEK
jgi:hypothetical protein